MERHQRDARPLPLAVFLFELRGHGGHRRLRLRDGDAGFHLAEDAQHDHPARRARGIDPDRAPDVGGDDRRLERGGHDAGDGRRLPVEQDGASDEPRIAVEQPSPQRIGQDHQRRFAGLVVGVGEQAAALRRHAEGREIGRRYRRAAQPLRFVDAGEVGGPAAHGGELVEHACALLPLDEEARRRPVALRSAARPQVLPDHHQAFGVLVG